MPANAGQVASAISHWCSLGPQGTLSETRLGLSGDATARLLIVNPGAQATRVTSTPWVHAGERWASACVLVPATGQAYLVIHGSGVTCGSRAPWEGGRLIARVPGAPTRRVAVQEPQFC